MVGLRNGQIRKNLTQNGEPQRYSWGTQKKKRKDHKKKSLLHCSVWTIGKARSAFVMLKNIWASGGISMRTKLRIFNSIVKSVLLYGCETWWTTQTMQQKIQTFLSTCLRRIYKVQWQEKIRNEDLWERAGQEPLARKWGHTLRKPASSTTRQALTWNPQGKRKRGRPRNSWRRGTEAKLKQQGTNWSGMTRAAQNRVRWRGVVDGLCSTRSDGHK